MSFGLALEGGGGRGAFHIGVWKALRELNIEVTAVTGTSIGALNGALFAMDEYDAACELWETVQTKDIIEMDEQLLNEVIFCKTRLDSIEAYFSLLKYILENRGLSIAPLKKMIRKYIDEAHLRRGQIHFGFVTVSVTEKKAIEVYLEDIPVGKVHDYLLASAYMPVFRSEDLDGKRFLDGAFFDNLPIRLLAKKGCKNVIAVHLNSIGLKQKVTDRSVEITHIYPSEDLGAILFFHPIQSRKNMQMGYLDTLKAFGHLKGNRYYLENVPSEEAIFAMLSQLPKPAIQRLAAVQGESAGNEIRFLFEFLLPQLAKFLQVPDQAGYQFLYLTLLEHGADTIGLYRLKRYDYTYFHDLVLPKFCAYKQEEILSAKDDLAWRLKNKRTVILYDWLKILHIVHSARGENF